MLHRFFDNYIVIIDYILHTYAYMKSYLKIISNLSLIFIAIFLSNYQPLLFRTVWAAYARALGLTFPIFHHHYLTGMVEGKI